MTGPRKQGDQTPPASATHAADVAADEAPEPRSGSKKKVAVVWPSNRFVVQGVPVVDNKGVPVTAEQQKKLEEAAKKAGVKLREVND